MGLEFWLGIFITLLLGCVLLYCFKKKDKVTGFYLKSDYFLLTFLLINVENHSHQLSSIENVSQQVLAGRMRKRDIVRYYGKRMIRKVVNYYLIVSSKLILIGRYGVGTPEKASKRKSV